MSWYVLTVSGRFSQIRSHTYIISRYLVAGGQFLQIRSHMMFIHCAASLLSLPQLASGWEDTPPHFLRLDITSLISDSNIDEVMLQHWSPGKIYHTLILHCNASRPDHVTLLLYMNIYMHIHVGGNGVHRFG